MNYLSKKEHLCDSLSWITLYGYVFFLDTSLIPILRAWSRQTFTSAACVELFQHSQEKISRAFFLWNIQAEGGLSWPQWPRRSWQGHGVDKESVGSWGSEGRKRWDKLLFLSQFFFFLLLEGWCFVWWECMLYFQYLLWPLINIDWFCEDLKSLISGRLCKSTVKRC